jgi:hypothetical protein
MFGVSQFIKAAKIVIPLLAVYFLVSLLPVFSSATESLRARSTDAYSTEGGMQHAMEQRTSGTILYMLTKTDYSSHALGIGMGRGAAAVSALSTGRVQFVAGEYEFVRELVELGPIPGIAFSLFRFLLALSLAFSAIKCAQRGEPLALLLMTPLFATLCFGTLEQPTDQGFMVTCVAFAIAAIRSCVVRVEGRTARAAAPPGPGRRSHALPGWAGVRPR